MHPLEALPRVECARELLRHCAPGSGMIVRSFFLPGYLLFCRFWHPPGTHFSGPKPNFHLLRAKKKAVILPVPWYAMLNGYLPKVGRYMYLVSSEEDVLTPRLLGG